MQSGGSTLQFLWGGIAGFLTWWRDELLGMIPERVQGLFARRRPETVLAQVDDGFAVVKDTPDGLLVDAENLVVLDLPEALSRLVKIAKSETTIGLRLPADQCFARNVELPMAARKDLRRILDIDLERATPFKHKDVYTAHFVAGQAAAQGKLRVRQLVTKREVVDPLVADVKEAGLDVGFVDCWSDRPSLGMPINFLEPRGVEEGAGRRIFRPTRFLLAGAALLMISALALTLWGYESALTELQAKTAQARTQAANVRSVLERSDVAVADLARLQDVRLKRIPAIEIMEEVTRVLPDAVWLTEMRIEGDTLDVSGLAASAAGLPALFERSTILADATLSAPVTFDQREDKERFSLRVRIKHQAALRQASTGDKGE